MRVHALLWFWKGWRPIYTWGHVNAMVRMLNMHLPQARVLCLTDQVQSTWQPAECEVMPLWPDPVPRLGTNRPNCYRRLRIFEQATQAALGIKPGDIVLSLDLDSIVLGPLSPLLEVYRHGPEDGYEVRTFAAMGGVAARIHGSLFSFRAGTHSELWRTFHPQLGPIQMTMPMRDGTPRPIGSDQAWMTRYVQGEHLWETADGCYSWNRHGLILSPGRTADARYWSFAGPNKPWSDLVKETRPDLYAAYMAHYGEQ